MKMLVRGISSLYIMGEALPVCFGFEKGCWIKPRGRIYGGHVFSHHWAKVRVVLLSLPIFYWVGFSLSLNANVAISGDFRKPFPERLLLGI